MQRVYGGYYNDKHGMTQLGRIVLDGGFWGLIPKREDCAGWVVGRMQGLVEKIPGRLNLKTAVDRSDRFVTDR